MILPLIASSGYGTVASGKYYIFPPSKSIPYSGRVIILGCKMAIASNRWNLIAVVYDTNRSRVDTSADDKL